MPFGRPTGHPCGRPILQSPPLRGRCRRSRQRGVFGGGGRGMAARFFLDEPPRPLCANATAIPSRAAAHPPLSCRTSPPQGGRSTWGGRPKDAAGVARSSTWGGRLAMRRMLDCGEADGHPCGRPILQSPPLRGRCRRSRQRGVFGGGGRGMAARFFLDEPPRTALRERHRHPQPSRRAPPSVLPDISPSRGEIDLGRAPKDAAGVARSLTWGGCRRMRRA